MRAPGQRMRDCGNGPDTITVYRSGIDAVANADEEGNWVKTPVAGADYPAIVDSYVATAAAENGTDLSVTVFTVMVITDTDPGIRSQDDVVHRGIVMVAQGDAVRAAGGAWAFQAVETGPDPDASGLPDGVGG